LSNAHRRVWLSAHTAMAKTTSDHVPICSGKSVKNIAKWHDLMPFMCELGAKNSVFDALLRSKMPLWGKKVLAMISMLAFSAFSSQLRHGTRHPIPGRYKMEAGERPGGRGLPLWSRTHRLPTQRRRPVAGDLGRSIGGARGISFPAGRQGR
jgi:hypothetical protein